MASAGKKGKKNENTFSMRDTIKYPLFISLFTKDGLTELISMIASMVEHLNNIIVQLPQEESSMAQTQVRTYFRALSKRRTKTKSSKKLRRFRLG